MRPHSKSIKQFTSFLLTLAFALSIRWGVAEAYVIPSGSMQPTLLVHDHIFVNKWIYGVRVPFSSKWLVHFHKPQRGEVIVFKDPIHSSIFLIKRIVGIPGDEIRYTSNHLFINGVALETHAPKSSQELLHFQELGMENLEIADDQHEHLIESVGGHDHAVLHRQGMDDREVGPLIVPEDSLFVMGDHRDNSFDSRGWGFVPRENILGQAMFVWMSCSESLAGSEAGCNPLTLRWNRLFSKIE